jgi:hypothetical protein
MITAILIVPIEMGSRKNMLGYLEVQFQCSWIDFTIVFFAHPKGMDIWLVVSKSFCFSIYGIIIQLTKSIIFQRGRAQPPTRICLGGSMVCNHGCQQDHRKTAKKNPNDHPSWLSPSVA